MNDLLAVAKTNKKIVLIATCTFEALCIYGAFLFLSKTHGKSHFGVRDLWTGRCNSKDLIQSDKTGLEPILFPGKFKCI